MLLDGERAGQHGRCVGQDVVGLDEDGQGELALVDVRQFQRVGPGEPRVEPVPVCTVDPDGPFAEGVATATEAACDVSPDVEFEEEGLFGR